MNSHLGSLVTSSGELSLFTAPGEASSLSRSSAPAGFVFSSQVDYVPSQCDNGECRRRSPFARTCLTLTIPHKVKIELISR